MSGIAGFLGPSITEVDLRKFHKVHFKDAPLPRQFFCEQCEYQDELVEDTDVFYQEDADELGYYSDGVKRTLTDDQIAIFRHSEIQRFLRGEVDSQPTSNGKTTRKRKRKKKKKKPQKDDGSTVEDEPSSLVEPATTSKLIAKVGQVASGASSIVNAAGEALQGVKDHNLIKSKMTSKQRRDTLRLRRHFKKDSPNTDSFGHTPASQTDQDVESDDSTNDAEHLAKRTKILRELADPSQSPQDKNSRSELGQSEAPSNVEKSSFSTKSSGDTLKIAASKMSPRDTNFAITYPSSYLLDLQAPAAKRQNAQSQGGKIVSQTLKHVTASATSQQPMETLDAAAQSDDEDADVRHDPEDYKPDGELFTYRRMARNQDEIKTQSFELDY